MNIIPFFLTDSTLDKTTCAMNPRCSGTRERAVVRQSAICMLLCSGLFGDRALLAAQMCGEEEYDHKKQK
jgi:hypothetical protein